MSNKLTSIPNSSLSEDYRTYGKGYINKAMQVIMAKELGRFELIDNKVYNYLLNRAFPDMRRAGGNGIYTVPVADILDFLGHSSTERLMASLDRLGSIEIVVDYVDIKGVSNSAKSHYISYNMAHSKDGFISFAFDPIMLELCKDPKIFATLWLNETRRFQSQYASSLFEIMSTFVNRENPTWTPTLEEFREAMKIGDAYPRFNNLHGKVIQTAIDEVNEIATFFRIEVEPLKAGKGGRVVGLRFEALRKGLGAISSSVDSMEAPTRLKVSGRSRDRNTIDLLDGRTDEERSHLEVSQEALKKAYRILPEGETIDSCLEAWRKEMSGRFVRYADRSFLNWLDVKNQKVADMLDEDTIGDFIEQWADGR